MNVPGRQPGEQDASSDDVTRSASPGSPPDEATTAAPAGTDDRLENTAADQRPDTAADTRIIWPRPAAGHVGQYELLEEQRPGGMARVFKARHVTIGKIVALKVMRTDMVSAERMGLRFEREAKAVAKLSHPNIIPIYEYATTVEHCYFTMPFKSGGNLLQHMGRYQRERRAAIELVEKIARAVQYAHEQGVLHRDLKPGNILLDENGDPHVSDFGLAKMLDDDLELTRAGEMLGTVPYMSPEQACGDLLDIGPASDVWSLGVILYELLTSKRPFAGMTTEQMRQNILTAQPVELGKICSDVDRSLEAVVLKCLQKAPGERYSSAGALAKDLRSWLDGKPTAVRPENVLQRTLRRGRRHPFVAAGLLTAALATAVACLIVTEPQRSLASINRTIAGGEPVVLVPAPGRRPSWFRWIGEEGRLPSAKVAGEDAFTINAGNQLAVMELVPAPPTRSYRFSAEVSHQNWEVGGDVGIYFGHSKLGGMDLLCTLTFDDIGRLSPGVPVSNAEENPARCDLRLLNESQNLHKYALHATPLQATHQGGKVWRKFAVIVGPEKIEYLLDDRSIFTTNAESLITIVERWINSAPPLVKRRAQIDTRDLEFRASQGIGLWVLRSKASFRNVVLTPLPEKNR